MNQLIDTIPTRKGKQDDIRVYREYARTATTDAERQMWRTAIDNMVNGVRPFPEDLEPLYQKLSKMWIEQDMTDREIADRFGFEPWVIEDFRNRRRMSDTQVRNLRKVDV